MEEIKASDALLMIVAFAAGTVLMLNALNLLSPSFFSISPPPSVAIYVVFVSACCVVVAALARSRKYYSCYTLSVAKGVPEEYLEERLRELQDLLLAASRSGVEVRYVRKPWKAALHLRSRRKDELERLAERLKSFGDVFEIAECREEPRERASVCVVLVGEPQHLYASVRDVIESLSAEGWRVTVVDWKDSLVREASSLPPRCRYYSVGRVLLIPERVRALVELVRREASRDLAVILVEPSELSIVGFEALAEALGVGRLVVVTTEPEVARNLEACHLLGR